MSLQPLRRRGALAAALVGSLAAASVIAAVGPASAAGSTKIFVLANDMGPDDLMFEVTDPTSTPPVFGSAASPSGFSNANNVAVELLDESQALELYGSMNSYTWDLLPGGQQGLTFDPTSFESVFGGDFDDFAEFTMSGLDAPTSDFPFYSTVRFTDGAIDSEKAGLVSFAEDGRVTAIVDFTMRLADAGQDDEELAIASQGTTMWVWLDVGMVDQIRDFPITDYATASPTVGTSRQVNMPALPDDTFPAPREADFEPGTNTVWLTFQAAGGGVGLAEIDYTNSGTSSEAEGYQAFSLGADVVPTQRHAISVIGAAAPGPGPGPAPGGGTTPRSGLAATGDDAGQLLTVAAGATAVVAAGVLGLAVAGTRRRRRG